MSKAKQGILTYIDMLGMNARDKVTGLTGVIVSVSFDLFGCVQAVLRPPVNKDGKLDDGHWFDVQRLEIDEKSKRVMDPPTFSESAEFAATPAKHKHGPADKPSRKY